MTRRLYFAACILAVFGLGIYGQRSKEDIERLKRQAGLPASEQVLQRKVSVKPGEIKIIFSVDGQYVREGKLIAWIADWNRKYAAQLGEVKVAANVSEANVAVVAFKYGVSKVVVEESVGVKLGRMNPPSSSDDAVTVLRDTGNDRVSTGTTVKRLPIPFYSYVLVRDQAGALHLNFARMDDIADDRDFPAKRLQAALAKDLARR